MIKLPEPVAHIYPSTLERFAGEETYGHCWSIKVGCPDETSEGLFTEAQLKQAVRDAYEDAAKVCETQDGLHDAIYAAAIRALIKEIPE